MASISHLPVELLTIILCLAKPSPRTNNKAANQSGRDLLPPHHYPFNYTNVSPLWRDILLHHIPSWHWTNLFILVDAVRPTPLHDLALYLQHSEDRPLCITVTRSLNVRGNARLPENESHVRRVIELLRPHFARCTSINFDLHRGSLLPSFSEDLAVRSLDLDRLSLRCEVDDAHPPIDLEELDFDPLEPIDSDDSEDDSIPRWELGTLVLSGYTIMDAIKHAPVLFKYDDESEHVYSITLSTYKLAPHEFPKAALTFAALRHALAAPVAHCKFALSDIQIPYVGDRLLPDVHKTARYTLVDLDLCNLSTYMVHNLLRLIDIDSTELKIRNCFLDRDHCLPFPDSIVNLHLDAVDCDLTYFFPSSIEMSTLFLNNCSCLNDEAIMMLANRSFTKDVVINTLWITDCTNFSAAAVYALLASSTEELTSVIIDGASPKISKSEYDMLQVRFKEVLEWSCEWNQYEFEEESTGSESA